MITSLFLDFINLSLRHRITIRITATENPVQGCSSYSFSLELTSTYEQKCDFSEKGRMSTVNCRTKSAFSLESAFQFLGIHGIHGISQYYECI